jgi:hypothetical protein
MQKARLSLVSKCYAPSDKIPFGAIIAIPLFYALVSSVLGVYYSYCIYNIPFVFLNLILLFTYAALTLFIASLSIKVFKSRYPLVSCVLVFLGITAGFYVSWAAWLAFIAHDLSSLSPEARTNLDFLKSFTDKKALCLALLEDPKLMWNFILDIYHTGTWYFTKSDSTIKGVPLLIFWIFEFVFFEFLVLYDAWTESSEPFYEVGNIWYKKYRSKKAFRLPESADSLERELSLIREGNFSFFLNAPFASEDDVKFLELEIYAAKGSFDAYGTVNLTAVNQYRKKEHSQGREIVKFRLFPSDLAYSIIDRVKKRK